MEGGGAEHLTMTQFKVMQEAKRLAGLTEQIHQTGTELVVVQQQLTVTTGRKGRSHPKGCRHLEMAA